MRVDVVWFGDIKNKPIWPLGELWPTDYTTVGVYNEIQKRVPGSDSAAWLFWDGALGTPRPEVIEKILNLPGDLWHCGLRLGMGGLPRSIDFISPTWMLNRDPDANIESTSWRLSLRACMVRTGVLQQIKAIRKEFVSVESAALEMGHRYIKNGVFTRHIPWLIDKEVTSTPVVLPFEDEILFAYHCFRPFWSGWALSRALFTRYALPQDVFKAYRKIHAVKQHDKAECFTRDEASSKNNDKNSDAKVSVVIPTLDRYEYLRTLLGQLREQTYRPYEIIVVDQTPKERNEISKIEEEFNDLPLRLILLEEGGQCSARNAALMTAKGDYMLFLDDDDEAASDLIEKHLKNLMRFNAAVSTGVADEVGVDPLSRDTDHCRASDVFPTHNTMVKRGIFHKSGLFDLAYEHGIRADGDLGMRVYLNGALMVLNPEISVLHYRAPKGGLRVYKERMETYASSRRRLFNRQLLTSTEIYLIMRYFSKRQLREAVWLAVLGTFSIRGGVFKKSLKAVIGLLCLPYTLFLTWCRYRDANEMFKYYPQIPSY